ncbi:histidine kinase dimerization/phosphoacceptor domain -containing protein [Methanothermobacter thermautotrophicus]|uniref:histidine kinase dimerization/phosphoacceptor domain -containing protein n=1 Tax=Methanothermobacter thermautotrophicus TaxID=145262 RepID=UPI00186666E5|nr:histidine kinase dimerization/phosphoacceptor domain -containing protein [Methanothermobacter thermautotrophicus]
MRRGNLEWSFLLIAITMTIWAMASSLLYTTTNRYALIFYILSNLAWILLPALFLNFAVVLSADKSPGKFTVIPIVPSFIFIYMLLVGSLIRPGDIHELMSWAGGGRGLFEAYMVGYFAAAVSLIWNHARVATSYRERKMSTLIFIVSSFSLIAGLILTTFISSSIHSINTLGQIVGMVGIAGIAHAIIKYHPPAMSPSLAGESILDKVTDLVILLDATGEIIRLNHRAKKELGLDSPGDWREIVAPEHHQKMRREFEDIMERASSSPGDYHHSPVSLEYVRADGERIPVKLFISLIREGSDAVGYSLVAQDLRHTLRLRDRIEESEKSEELTRMRLHEFRTLNEAIVRINHSNSPEELFRNVMALLNEHLGLSEGAVYLVSDGVLRPMDDGFRVDNPEEILEEMDDAVLVRDDLIAVALKHDNRNLGLMAFRNGHDLDEYELRLLETVGGEAASTLKRIFYEDRLLESLEEKELLLREIHHRVKNNLQVISSLLNLQSSYIDDPGVTAVLRDSQGRIMSMSMIHEKLYRSGNLADIDVRGYLEGLARSIMFSYMRPDQHVDLKFEMDDIRLNVDTIMPLGLIVNELVTNAFKYAFPDGGGEVRVSLRRDGDGFLLTVADDGVGLPDDFNLDSLRSLGMLLVRNLTDQLNGELEYTSNGGTEFRVRFSEIQYRKRF